MGDNLNFLKSSNEFLKNLINKMDNIKEEKLKDDAYSKELSECKNLMKTLKRKLNISEDSFEENRKPKLTKIANHKLEENKDELSSLSDLSDISDNNVDLDDDKGQEVISTHSKDNIDLKTASDVSEKSDEVAQSDILDESLEVDLKECHVVLTDILDEYPERKEEAEALLCDIIDKKLAKLSKLPTKDDKKAKYLNNPKKKSSNKNHNKKYLSDKLYESDLSAYSKSSESESEPLDYKPKFYDNNAEENLLSNTSESDNDKNNSSNNSENSDHSNYSEKMTNKRSSKSKPKSEKDGSKKRVTRSIKMPKLSSDDENDKPKSRGLKRLRKDGSEEDSLPEKSDSDCSVTDLREQMNIKKKNLKDKRHNKSTGKKSKFESKKSEKVASVAATKADSDEVETRKIIHRIIGTNKLSEATKTAAQLETERRKRIEERQKIYNDSLDEDKIFTESEDKLLVLEKDEDGNDLVTVHPDIVKHLKPHQKEAVRFLYDCVIETIANSIDKSEENENDHEEKDAEDAKSQSSKSSPTKTSSSAVGGCILAHCMGLGKTLSLISFMYTMLVHPSTKFTTCLVICPVNTALNWKNEWNMWMPKSNGRHNKKIQIYEICSADCKKYKVEIVEKWHKHGGVLIIGYEMYRCLAGGDARMIRRKALRQKMTQALLNPGPDFVVCDEGHLLKNHKSAISKVISQIVSKRRIVLTGTPLQNKLLEYHTMVQFVKPSLLGTQKEFLNRFVNPINNGQHTDSTQYDVKLMKKRSHILFKTLDGCVHRRDYTALVKYLPAKYEYIVKVRLSNIQIDLYRKYLIENKSERNRNSLFTDQQTLARIWTHPYVICMHQEIQDKKMLLADTDEDSFIDDEDSDADEFEDKHRSANGDKAASKHQLNNKSRGGVKSPGNIIDLISDDEVDDEAVLVLDSDDDDNIKKSLTNPTKNGKDKITETKDNSSSSGASSSEEEVVRNWSTTTRRGRKLLQDSDDEDGLSGSKNGGSNNGENSKFNGRNNEKNKSENDDGIQNDKHWWSGIIKDEHENHIEISGKLVVLFQILRKASDIGDKVIIFSQSLLVLDIIEKYLQELNNIQESLVQQLEDQLLLSASTSNAVAHQPSTSPNKEDDSKPTEEPAEAVIEDREAPKTGEADDYVLKLDKEFEQKKNAAYLSDVGYNSWIRGLDYDRMDGSTQAVTRADIQNKFNADDDRRLRLFLISTRAGGMGINLVAANRVVIFDVSWNPSHDVQAIFRTYRFGQTKPVYVYRLVAQGSMEEKIYERQVMKQSLALRVVDEQQISRHFSEEDLRTLYKFEPDIYQEDKVRETPILPKDRLLADLLHELPQWIYSYHEHDSLLVNNNDEQLTEAERQEAWKEFEEEKSRGEYSRTTAGSGSNLLPTSGLSTEQLSVQQSFDHILQYYPTMGPLYAQNFEYLQHFVLQQKPHLKYQPILLNIEVKSVFMRSLSKLYNFKPDFSAIRSAETAAGNSASSSNTGQQKPIPTATSNMPTAIPTADSSTGQSKEATNDVSASSPTPSPGMS